MGCMLKGRACRSGVLAKRRSCLEVPYLVCEQVGPENGCADYDDGYDGGDSRPNIDLLDAWRSTSESSLRAREVTIHIY